MEREPVMTKRGLYILLYFLIRRKTLLLYIILADFELYIIFYIHTLRLLLSLINEMI